MEPDINNELEVIAAAMEAEIPAESLDELVARKRREQGISSEEQVAT